MPNRSVNIGGVVVSNATLHNEDEIIRKILNNYNVVERAGDMYYSFCRFYKRKKDQKIYFPLKCPSCGSKTIKEFNLITKKIDAVRRCTSEGYDVKNINRKNQALCFKKALNIDGLEKKLLKNFII